MGKPAERQGRKAKGPEAHETFQEYGRQLHNHNHL